MTSLTVPPEAARITADADAVSTIVSGFEKIFDTGTSGLLDEASADIRIALCAINEFELGFLAAGVLLLAGGIVCQLKSTTLTGGALTVLYFATLLIFIPWTRLNAVAWFILIGGGLVFGAGLALSVFREQLLTLPERIRRREGAFRVLRWR